MGILDIGTTQPLTITGNTILNNLGQTDAISLDATLTGQAIANKNRHREPARRRLLPDLRRPPTAPPSSPT
jgi:hypothetical protein